MSNPNIETKVMELMEPERMKEELETEIAAAEDEIKAVMEQAERLLAGAFKVAWTPDTSSCPDTIALKKHESFLLTMKKQGWRNTRQPWSLFDAFTGAAKHLFQRNYG